MASKTLTLAAAFCLSLAAGQAAAQNISLITKDQSKLILEMPGMDGGQETFQYFGWNGNYSREIHYAAQGPRSGLYPRAQVYYTKLAPPHEWVIEGRIDEARIGASAQFLKDKKITVTQPDPGGRRERRLVRFEMDGADCAYFSIILGGMTFGNESSASGTRGNVSGFYCGGLGAKLTEADIAAVMNGWRIIP